MSKKLIIGNIFLHFRFFYRTDAAFKVANEANAAAYAAVNAYAAVYSATAYIDVAYEATNAYAG